jgi:serine/threonine protein kinase
MKDCKRVKQFKPFHNLSFNDISIGYPTFAANIYSVLDKDGNELPLIAKLSPMSVKGVENEVHIQSYAGLHGIAPKIYDFFVCNHESKRYYTILMDKLDGLTLDDFIQSNGNVVSALLRKRIKKSIDRLYDLGIRHDDMHGGNFIISDKNVYIIDFGDVKLYKTTVPQQERTYTIQINIPKFGNLVVGAEDPMVLKIQQERIEKMKKAVANAKVTAITNEIDTLRKTVERFKKSGKNKMAETYEKVISQKLALLESIKLV